MRLTRRPQRTTRRSQQALVQQSRVHPSVSPPLREWFLPRPCRVGATHFNYILSLVSRFQSVKMSRKASISSAETDSSRSPQGDQMFKLLLVFGLLFAALACTQIEKLGASDSRRLELLREEARQIDAELEAAYSERDALGPDGRWNCVGLIRIGSAKQKICDRVDELEAKEEDLSIEIRILSQQVREAEATATAEAIASMSPEDLTATAIHIRTEVERLEKLPWDGLRRRYCNQEIEAEVWDALQEEISDQYVNWTGMTEITGGKATSRELEEYRAYLLLGAKMRIFFEAQSGELTCR